MSMQVVPPVQPGLISVTFRKLPPERIIELAVRAGLKAIEWGGDIHVPHGDVKRAAEVGARTRSAGLAAASYGSYYRVGCRNAGPSGEPPLEFARVLETAAALRSPAIRVWAGDRGSAAADEAMREQVAADAWRIADLAQAAGVEIGLEYHGGTLTDTVDSAVRLLADIGHPNVRCHWQPQVQLTAEQNVQALRQVLPWLANLHVFHWLPEERLPLADGQEEWRRYLAAAGLAGLALAGPTDSADVAGAAATAVTAAAVGASATAAKSRTRYALLEFVKGDDPEQFLRDAAALRELLEASDATG